MSTDELDLSINTFVPDNDLIPAFPSWEKCLESTYPTQPPSLNENQTYLTTSTNKPPIFDVEKVQLTQEEFLLAMQKKVKRLKKMIEDPLTLFDDQKIMETIMSSFISKVRCIEDGSTLPPESVIIIGNASLLPKHKEFSNRKDKAHKRTQFKAVQENQEKNVHKDSWNLITPVVINNNDSPIPSSYSIYPQNNLTLIDSQVFTKNCSITPSHQASSNPNPSKFNSMPPNSPIFFQHATLFLQSINMFEKTIGAHHNSLVHKAIHYLMEKRYQQSEQEASFPTPLPCSIRFLSAKTTLDDEWIDQFQTDCKSLPLFVVEIPLIFGHNL
ncbi:hypothetical protein O181_013182 [Austropuccinia psidii MF-1]|uniref:Uncharacterized protein n=1 Tax=Austropuccinia psidii MF-1 TaxID=1389203 RepID=A0A9Q3BXT5_9BASI|nr:hypothetical protein [Austropuccinia psidii MF-1]